LLLLLLLLSSFLCAHSILLCALKLFWYWGFKHATVCRPSCCPSPFLIPTPRHRFQPARQPTIQSASQLVPACCANGLCCCYCYWGLPCVWVYVWVYARCSSMFLQASNISCCLQERNQLNISSHALPTSGSFGFSLSLLLPISLSRSLSFSCYFPLSLFLRTSSVAPCNIGTCLTRNYFGPVALFSMCLCVWVSHCVL